MSCSSLHREGTHRPLHILTLTRSFANPFQKKHTTRFFVIVLVVTIAEVAGAVVILVFKPLAADLINKLGDKAVEGIKKGYGENADVTGLWNTTMDTLKCCGFYSYADFTDSPYYNNNLNEYPPQCCPSTATPCDSAVANSVSNTTITGCFPKFKKLIDDNSIVIVAVALGIAALEICAMAVSMTLYCKIGSKTE